MQNSLFHLSGLGISCGIEFLRSFVQGAAKLLAHSFHMTHRHPFAEPDFLRRDAEAFHRDIINSQNTADMECHFPGALRINSCAYDIIGRCQSNDFDAQVADVTITFLTYIVAALDLRFSEYETMGQLFDSMEEELTRLTLWNTILDCIEKILGNLLERCGINLDDVIADILRDGEAAKEIIYMAKAMEEYRRAG